MKNICRKFLLLAGALLLLGSSAFAHEEDDLMFFHPVTITKNVPLSVTDCISLAYQNSPKIKRQKYNLDIASSNLGIAKAAYFPVISAGAGFYNENNSDSVYYDKHYRDLPSVGVSVNTLVWDFGKTTSLIKMEKFYKIGAEYEFMDSLCSTLFDVKWKYYSLLYKKALLDIANDDLARLQNIYDNAKKSPDKETALVYLTRAKILCYEAQNDYKNAKLDLDNSMYVVNSPDYEIDKTETFNFSIYNSQNKDLEDFTKHEFPFKRSEAASIAYHNSPDLHVLIATKKAMIQSLKYIKRTYLPALSANVGYGYNNTNQTSNSSLQVGVNLNSSVNLLELKHSIKGADAQVARAQNEIDLFKKDLYYDIFRALNNADKAAAQISLAQDKVKQSYAAMKLVEEKYKAGAIDYTSLHDSREDYVQANTDYADSLYDYNTALIQVEMAMHCHLVDIHHKSGHAVHHHSDELINNLIKALECNKPENKKLTKSEKVKSLLWGSGDDDDDLEKDIEENL